MLVREELKSDTAARCVTTGIDEIVSVNVVCHDVSPRMKRRVKRMTGVMRSAWMYRFISE
jgi:hypothetical protein